MQRSDALSYHSRRATRELDLGLAAASMAVARAHLQLAAMHMERLRELTARSISAPIAAIA
jgi:hypothetical protein